MPENKTHITDYYKLFLRAPLIKSGIVYLPVCVSILEFCVKLILSFAFFEGTEEGPWGRQAPGESRGPGLQTRQFEARRSPAQRTRRASLLPHCASEPDQRLFPGRSTLCVGRGHARTEVSRAGLLSLSLSVAMNLPEGGELLGSRHQHQRVRLPLRGAGVRSPRWAEVGGGEVCGVVGQVTGVAGLGRSLGTLGLWISVVCVGGVPKTPQMCV